jgi:Tfp pilus assembly protein PilF
MIKAVAELTPLILGGCVFITLIVYRKTISKVIENASEFKLKKGDTELSLVNSKETKSQSLTTENNLESGISDPVEPTDKEKQNEQKIIEQSLIEDNDGGSLFLQMCTAFYPQKDLNKAKELFDKLQNSTDDHKTRLLHEIWFWHCSYLNGDISAIGKLQQLSKNNEIAGTAHSVLGGCYETAYEFQKAANEYELAAEHGQSDQDRARNLVKSSICYFKLKNKTVAFERLILELREATSNEAKSLLYEGLATLYGLAEDWDLQAVSLEKYIEYNPNNIDKLFQTAYSYSKNNHSLLALIHYRTLLKFKDDSAPALNNIGLLYQELNILMKAVSNYKDSYQQGNTLAGANLAYLYMNAGFVEEAKQILDEAKNNNNLHPNIGKAIADIEEKKEAEDKEVEEYIQIAQQQQQFIRFFADAYFCNEEYPITLAGNWGKNDEIQFHITQNNDSIQVNWNENNNKTFSGAKKFSFTGKLNNRGINITQISDSVFAQSYGYISSEYNTIKIMLLYQRTHLAPLFLEITRLSRS